MNTKENTTIPADQKPAPEITGFGRYQQTYIGKHIRPATKLQRFGLGWPTSKGEAR